MRMFKLLKQQQFIESYINKRCCCCSYCIRVVFAKGYPFAVPTKICCAKVCCMRGDTLPEDPPFLANIYIIICYIKYL